MGHFRVLITAQQPFIEQKYKFKFIDDLSILEIINLLSIGLATYNYKQHVPSDVPANGYVIPNQNLDTQHHLDKISQWTKTNKMQLNANKTKTIIFNFSKQKQFTSRIRAENETVEIITQAKLLGVIVNNRLTWDENTNFLIKKAN